MKKRPAKKQAKKRTAKSKPAAKPVAKQEAKKRANRRNAPVAPRPPRRRPSETRAIDKRDIFLRAFALCGSIRDAAKAAKVDHHQHYDWMKERAYAERFQEMKVQAGQALEDEAIDRAVRGVYEPNVFQGRFIYPQEEIVIPAVLGPRGGIQEPERREWRDVPGAQPLGIWRKSDTLLIQLLRGAMPEKYGYRGALELTGPQGGPMEIVQRLNAARARRAAKTAESA